MREVSKKVIEKYQVRKTRKQKTEFLDFLWREVKGLDMVVEESGILKSRNLIVGDLENSKVVLAAHYDTAPVLPFPNFLAPKNVIAYLLYCLLLLIGLMAVEAVAAFIVVLLTGNPDLMVVVDYVLLAFFIYWVYFGKANKHTMNDNTSGVITLLEALQDEEIRKHACFVFFDHEEIGLFGSRFFAKKHKQEMKEKLLFNFDCVGDGNTLMLILSKDAKAEKEKMEATFLSEEDKKVFVTSALTTIYPSDQMRFKKGVGVAAFRRNKLFGYYLDKVHTRNDVVLEERNIEVLIKGMKRYIEGIAGKSEVL